MASSPHPFLSRRSLTVPDGPQIVAQAPPGSNPYAYLRAFVSAILTPQLPTSFFTGLIALAVVIVIGIGFAVAIIIVPFLQGRDSVQRNLWVIRRKYVSQYRRPYIVPNFVLALSISFFIHALFSQVYIWTNYESYVNLDTSLDRQVKTRIFFWYGIIWIPAYIGFWFSGFSGIYAAWLASSPGTSLTGTKHRWLRPEVLNSICWGIPVLVLFSTVALASTEGVKHEKLLSDSAAFLANLDSAAATYDRDGKLGTAMTVPLFAQSTAFRDEAEAFFATFAACIGLWAFWLFLACLTHLGAMIALLRIVGARLRSSGTGEGVSLTKFFKRRRGKSPRLGFDEHGTEESALGRSPSVGNGHAAANLRTDDDDDDDRSPHQTPAAPIWTSQNKRKSRIIPTAESWKRFTLLGPAGLNLDLKPPPSSDDVDDDGAPGPPETSEATALRRTYWTVLVHFSILVVLSAVMLGTALWTISNLAEIEFRPKWRSATILLGIWPLALAGALGMGLLLVRIIVTSRITLDGHRPVRPLSGAADVPGHLASRISEADAESVVGERYADDPRGDEAYGGEEEEVEELEEEAVDPFMIEGEDDKEADESAPPKETPMPAKQQVNEDKSQIPASRRVPVPLMTPEVSQAREATLLPPAESSDPFADSHGVREIGAPASRKEGPAAEVEEEETPGSSPALAEPGSWHSRGRVMSGYSEVTSEVDEFLDAVDFGWRDAS